ncbi:hypothetical protein V6N13_036922 [Hibiscus sabdariffa]
MPLTPMATRKPSEEVHVVPDKKEKKRGRKRKVDPNMQESSAGHVDDVDMRFRSYESASARKRTVTAEEKERAIENKVWMVETISSIIRNLSPNPRGAVLMSSAFAILAKMLKCSFSNVAAVALKANIFDVTSIRASPI